MKEDRFFSYDRKRDNRKKSTDPSKREDALALERLKRQPPKRTFWIDVGA